MAHGEPPDHLYRVFPYSYGVPIAPVPQEIKQKIAVNKQTHRIRFEDETEDSVTIVVEPKEQSKVDG